MKNTSYITVFGATGRIGGELIRLLSAAGIPTLAATRNKNKATQLPFVNWLEADMNDKESLRTALEHSSSVFLISGAGDNIIEQQCQVIDVAAAVGVQHIVKLSSAMANPGSPLFIGRVHGLIEEHLKSSGVNGTLLRPTGFMQNWFGSLLHTVKTQRKIYEATGDGKRAYVDLRDIAAAAFKILVNPEKHNCHAYVLTGGEALHYGQIAATLSEAIGEHVTYIPITPETARLQLEQKGLPEAIIATFIAYAADQRNGFADFVSPDVPDILEKPARTVAAFFYEHAELFK